MRRSLKIRGRRKEKEKLPSGITADYSASFFAQLDRDVLDDAHNSVNSSSTVVGLTQSDSSEASLNSLSNSKNLPPLPPKPPKRGILKGPRLSAGPIASCANEPTSPTSAVAMFQNGQDGHVDSNNVLVRNTLQNELIAYQNLPLQQQQRLNARDDMQIVFSEEETTTYQMIRSPQQMHQFGHGQQDSKLLHVRDAFIIVVRGYVNWNTRALCNSRSDVHNSIIV